MAVAGGLRPAAPVPGFWDPGPGGGGDPIQALGLMDGDTTLAEAVSRVTKEACLQEESVRPLLAADVVSLARCGWIRLPAP